jgi:hypothetical protein
MGFPKYREDDLERRIENRAAILDEYQPSFTDISLRALPASTPGDERYFHEDPRPESVELLPLTVREKIILRILAMKLQSGSGHSAREVVTVTSFWSPAHFEELARISPQASVRLNIILARNYHNEPVDQEPSFRAVVAQRREVVVEIRKRRPGLLQLREFMY